MNKQVKVDYWELVTAAERWDAICPRNTFETFERYLQLPRRLSSLYKINQDCWFMDEEAARKLRLLLSPYYKTIIKIAVVRMEASL